MLIHSPKELASFINDQRKQQRISQAEAGDKVGLKQTTISKFETSAEGTKLSTLFRILSALELEMHVMTKAQGKEFSIKKWTEEW